MRYPLYSCVSTAPTCHVQGLCTISPGDAPMLRCFDVDFHDDALVNSVLGHRRDRQHSRVETSQYGHRNSSLGIFLFCCSPVSAILLRSSTVSAIEAQLHLSVEPHIYILPSLLYLPIQCSNINHPSAPQSLLFLFRVDLYNWILLPALKRGDEKMILSIS